MSRGETRQRGNEHKKDKVHQWVDLTSVVEAGVPGEAPTSPWLTDQLYMQLRPRLVPGAEQRVSPAWTQT